MRKPLFKIIILVCLVISFTAEGFFIWKILKKDEISHSIKLGNTANIKSKIKGEVLNQPEKQKNSATILFVGDLMFDRYIRQVAEKKGSDFIFEKVRDLLNQADLVVANLEGPITSNQSRSISTAVGERGHLIFTFDKSLALTLYKNNIKLVNLGNNHTANFGSVGIDQTKRYLTEAKVEYFGNDGEEHRTKIKNMGGTKLGFINYNQFIQTSPEKTLEGIEKLKKETDFLVVYTHWGAEYKTGEPDENIKKLARLFVDSGADLVIGTHPHVVESEENYRGKKIFYSLGNFIFDQYFSAETRRGLAVKIKIDSKGQVEFEKINLFLENNGQTRPDKI